MLEETKIVQLAATEMILVLQNRDAVDRLQEDETHLLEEEIILVTDHLPDVRQDLLSTVTEVEEEAAEVPATHAERSGD